MFTIVNDLTLQITLNKILAIINQPNVNLTGLVHNAAETILNNFEMLDLAEQQYLLKLLINMPLALTHMCLPKLSQNKGSHILVLSSIYAFIPTPKQAIYSAAKSFQNSFFIALLDELKGKVDVSIVCPGITNTRFRRNIEKEANSKKLFSMTAHSVAKIAYKAVCKKKAVVIAGGFNKAFCILFCILPTIKLKLKVIGFINKKRNITK